MEHGPRRGVVLARVLVALLVGLSATACGGEQKQVAPLPAPTVSTAPPDLGVEATGLPEGVAFGVTETEVGAEDGANLDFVSPVFTVEPAGALDDPVTITVELDNAQPTTTPLLVATRTSADARWSYQPGQLSSDQRHVEYQTRNLYQLGVVAIGVDAAVQAFHADIAAGLASGVDKRVTPPSCDFREAARETGYSVVASKATTLHWCFGLDGEKRVLKVRNRLVSPIQVAHPNVVVLEAPQVPAAYAAWSRILGTDTTFLAPGRTATYDADLQPLASLTVNADAGAPVQSLRLLQATVRAIALRLTSFDAGPTNVAAAVKTLLAMPQCRKSLPQGVSPLLAGCFSSSKLIRTFGSRGLLVAPLVAAPATPGFFLAQAQALATAQPAAVHRIDVKRAAPDFTTLAGFWTGKDRLLTITGQGIVSETVNNGLEPVVMLAYQLTDPIAADGVTTAKATITSVSVGNRKLLKGRVPRVGDQGTISLRGGVVRPPFLKIGYCDAAQAKKGGCGIPRNR